MAETLQPRASLKNDLLLRAARGEHTGRTPVWVMRQAGRILKEYRAVREKAGDFRTLVQTPEMAAEVTIQPVDILGVDAAIIFSDILVVPDAMGLTYVMDEGKGPRFPETVRSIGDLHKLRVPDVADDLHYVAQAIRMTKEGLAGRVPLIGFAGAPWTIFCYMTEGKGSKTFSMARRSLFADPAFAHDLLGRITDTTIAYLKLQVEAGADLIQVFDSWAGVMDRETYRAFAIPYLKRICESITEVPVTVFAKDAWFALGDIAELPCATIGLDWAQDAAWARTITGPGRTLQGNLDPCVLYADGAVIERETARMLNAFGPQRHIANLGHGVYPDTPVDHVRRFIDTVKEHQHPAS
ncbi:MAG: uroporphyrinogen decarboxylase [Flavobacteriales bacterium]|nr:uroporphyrinogen decarboxylase [Flavobacteriales bacterium]